MLRKIARKAFVENATIKGVALILAITVFILVRGDKETERVVKVSVAYAKPDDRVLMADLPDSVSVRVRGPWTRIKRLDPENVEPILVDLTKLSDGEFLFDEDMIDLPPGLRVASIK